MQQPPDYLLTDVLLDSDFQSIMALAETTVRNGLSGLEIDVGCNLVEGELHSLLKSSV